MFHRLKPGASPWCGCRWLRQAKSRGHPAWTCLKFITMLLINMIKTGKPGCECMHSSVVYRYCVPHWCTPRGPDTACIQGSRLPQLPAIKWHNLVLFCKYFHFWVPVTLHTTCICVFFLLQKPPHNVLRGLTSARTRPIPWPPVRIVCVLDLD